MVAGGYCISAFLAKSWYWITAVRQERWEQVGSFSSLVLPPRQVPLQPRWTTALILAFLPRSALPRMNRLCSKP